jgi:hypothetical protein
VEVGEVDHAARVGTPVSAEVRPVQPRRLFQAEVVKRARVSHASGDVDLAEEGVLVNEPCLERKHQRVGVNRRAIVASSRFMSRGTAGFVVITKDAGCADAFAPRCGLVRRRRGTGVLARRTPPEQPVGRPQVLGERLHIERGRGQPPRGSVTVATGTLSKAGDRDPAVTRVLA